MAGSFYSILTTKGKTEIAAAVSNGTKVNFVTLKVGDGNGQTYDPVESQTTLARTVWSGTINNVKISTTNSNWIVIEAVIPASVGGFYIREAGVFDASGNMLSISKIAETYKPTIEEGSLKDLTIKIILEVSSSSAITLQIDPTVQIATKQEVQAVEAKVEAIQIGGRNHYIPSVNALTYSEDLSKIDTTEVYGFSVHSNKTLGDCVTIPEAFNSNGFWTVSWEMKGWESYAVQTGVSVSVDICGRGTKQFTTAPNEVWKKYSYTVEVTNNNVGTNNFIKFKDFDLGFYYFRNINVEKSTKDSDFTQSPEEVALLVDSKIQNEVKDLQVGGRNYIPNSEEEVLISTTQTPFLAYHEYPNTLPEGGWVIDEVRTYTLTIIYNPVNGKTTPFSYIKVSENIQLAFNVENVRPYVGDKKVYVQTFSIDGRTGAYLLSAITLMCTTSDEGCLIKGIKLETGSKSTSMTLAQEDIQAQIASLWTHKDETTVGTTAQRPDAPRIGEACYDTTLGKPIWWNGTVWKDAMGTTA